MEELLRQAFQLGQQWVQDMNNDKKPTNFNDWYNSDETQSDLKKLLVADVSGCGCDEEDKHGWTEVKCCNECGLIIEDFWNKHTR